MALNQNLAVNRFVYKCGTRADPHVYFTLVNIFHVDTLHGKWHHHRTIFQIFQHEVLLALVFLVIACDLTVFNTNDIQMVTLN